MAAVTTNSTTYGVAGNQRQYEFNVTIANTGDTLSTGFAAIKSAVSNDTAITKLAVSGGTITFTTTGAVSNALVMVTGY